MVVAVLFYLAAELAPDGQPENSWLVYCDLWPECIYAMLRLRDVCNAVEDGCKKFPANSI